MILLYVCGIISLVIVTQIIYDNYIKGRNWFTKKSKTKKSNKEKPISTILFFYVILTITMLVFVATSICKLVVKYLLKFGILLDEVLTRLSEQLLIYAVEAEKVLQIRVPFTDGLFNPSKREKKK